MSQSHPLSHLPGLLASIHDIAPSLPTVDLLRVKVLNSTITTTAVVSSCVMNLVSHLLLLPQKCWNNHLFAKVPQVPFLSGTPQEDLDTLKQSITVLD